MTVSSVIKASPPFEFKGSLLSLLILHLLDSDKARITEQLIRKIEQAPDFFKQVPIVIDLHAVQGDNNGVDLPYLVNLLRNYGLVPVAVRGGNPHQHEIATSMALGLLTASASKIERFRRELSPVEEPVVEKDEQSILLPTKIITQPVRSGQQIVAPQGDLVILAAVNPGAEVLASRHIHIYGALRGRALAGINGDTQAHIFCQHFEAELVSIAGHYQINEQIANDLQNRATQVYLAEDILKIEAFDIHTR